ncbi:MAG TPA: hypothetical protein VIL71_08525 [Spirillospora sp.]
MAEHDVSEPLRGHDSDTLAGTRRLRTPGRAIVVLVAVAVAPAVVFDATLQRTEKVGALERQPATVTYEDDNTHYVGVIRRRSLALGRHGGYALYTGRDPEVRYGHFVRVGLGSDETRLIPRSVGWDRAGVRVVFTSGHELFVPARFYVGGR